ATGQVAGHRLGPTVPRQRPGGALADAARAFTAARARRRRVVRPGPAQQRLRRHLRLGQSDHRGLAVTPGRLVREDHPELAGLAEPSADALLARVRGAGVDAPARAGAALAR